MPHIGIGSCIGCAIVMAAAIGFAAALPHQAASKPQTQSKRLDLVDVAATDPRVQLDIKYATADNFSGKQQYPVGRCLLRRAVAHKLLCAQDILSRTKPGMRLLLKDCYRPVHIQRALFESVVGTAKAGYVANPNRIGGAVHTYGAAVDVTLADAAGHEVDMGTPYDYLGPLAEPRRAQAFLATGALTQGQIAQRRLLCEVMHKAGFIPISNEWWHFDAWQNKALRARYAPLDVPLTSVLDAAL